MRRIQLLGAALFALFAFGVLTTAPAMATMLLAEWLVNGTAVTTELLIEITGELLLEDSKGALGASAMILCSEIFDGWVGPNSLGWISEILNLSGVAISDTPLSGTALECTGQTACETNTAVLVWIFGLPAETEVLLLEQTGGPFFDGLILKKFGWYVTDCLVLGISAEDECAAAGATVTNFTLSGTTLVQSLSTAITELIGGETIPCTVGGTNTGESEGSGTVTLSGGGELTASSETSTS